MTSSNVAEVLKPEELVIADAAVADLFSLSNELGSVTDFQEIKLYPNYVTTKINGIEKAISLAEFKTIFDQLVAETVKLENISLPFGCYNISVGPSDISLACYYPGQVKTIKHLGRAGGDIKEYTIPFPNMVISHKLKKDKDVWVVQYSKYFVTKVTPNKLPEVVSFERGGELKMPPFTNVYEDCKLCFGQNTMPVRFTKNLRGLDYYYQVLFDSPFNDDLGIKGVRTNLTPEAWYAHLATLKAFPYDKLS